VYVAVLDADGDEVGPAILDVRKHQLMRLAPEIPAAIIAFGRKKRDDAAEREAEESRRKAVARANAEVARRRAFGNDTPSGRPLDEDGSESPSKPEVGTVVNSDETTPTSAISRDAGPRDDPTPDDA
jgi:hypothetical protein